MSSRLARFVPAAMLAGLMACADFERGPRTPDVEPMTGGTAGGGGTGGTTMTGPPDGGGVADTDQPMAPGFAADVHPLLISRCLDCHSAGGDAGDTAFVLKVSEDDYEHTLELIDTNTPASSRLLSKGSGTGHQGGSIFAKNSTEYQTILAWIEGGALP